MDADAGSVSPALLSGLLTTDSQGSGFPAIGPHSIRRPVSEAELLAVLSALLLQINADCSKMKPSTVPQ